MKDQMTPHDLEFIEDTMVAWLIYELSGISEDAWGCSWIDGIEKEVFRIVERGVPKVAVEIGQHQMAPCDIESLSKFIEVTGMWMTEDKEGNFTKIPVDEYRSRIAAGE